MNLYSNQEDQNSSISLKKNSRFLSTGHGILPSCGCKARETMVAKCECFNFSRVLGDVVDCANVNPSARLVKPWLAWCAERVRTKNGMLNKVKLKLKLSLTTNFYRLPAESPSCYLSKLHWNVPADGVVRRKNEMYYFFCTGEVRGKNVTGTVKVSKRSTTLKNRVVTPTFYVAKWKWQACSTCV